MSRPLVSSLTPEQAVAELEQLLDAKPPEEQALDLIHWRRDHQERVNALEAWLTTHPASAAPAAAPAPEPVPEPTPMPKPKNTPAQLLALKIETYRKNHAKLVLEPGTKKLRDNLNTVRYEIRDLCKRIGCAVPDLPEPPESPFGHKPRKAMKAAPHRPAAPAPEPSSMLAVSAPPLPRWPGVIHELRRGIWLLMADMETMSDEDRVALQDDLALLDAAAHAAVGLAQGRLEVA